ncbi:hypothetical protein [Hyphomonas chukchiensis]|uniref:Uncharacterized protein n=1 Tax=Hyphomonas chukchiensis TaxID=1280947 RepID=A0A062UDB6_9PROT|nr:hypothetical protein [Hyphomonas chukchiensis]KCZ54589.1 hypothetical protein HY30_09895 [Hyphomonas chukchiensis]
MDVIDQIRRRIVKALELTEDANEQAIRAQHPVLEPEDRLREIQSLGGLLDKARSHCDKAETAMLKYIRLQSE